MDIPNDLPRYYCVATLSTPKKGEQDSSDHTAQDDEIKGSSAKQGSDGNDVKHNSNLF